MFDWVGALINPFWIFILLVVNIVGIIQLIGYFGQGRKSKLIENFSFLVCLGFFALSFYLFNLVSGLVMIFITTLFNTLIAVPLVKWLFIRWIGYVPRDRENLRNDIFEEMISIGNSFSLIDIERKIKEREKK